MQSLPAAMPWPLWRRILFRCCFILLLLIAAPWNMLYAIPGVSLLLDFYGNFISWLVNGFNRSLLHVRPVLVPTNGSGDTSFGWAELWTYCLLSLAGGVLWSAIDRRRTAYTRLNYWLCVIVRYYLAFVALSYGIDKVFLQQMPFPSLSQMSTPLGDFLPMRLSWMFLGYSGTYQFFSGLMECLVGLLLLYRRTATLGALLAAGVFLNVTMLNLSYDIPVKIFSLEMLAMSLFLLTNEWRRVACFFILNRPADACSIYHYPLLKRWMRVGRVALKGGFLILAVMLPVIEVATRKASASKGANAFRAGIYDVTSFMLKGDTPADSLRWADLIIDGDGSGSIKTADTAFRRRYGRAYFSYHVDTLRHTISLKNKQTDSLVIVSLQYAQPDTATILLSGTYKGDSLQVSLMRSRRHFQLAERQFHWLSEANR